MMYGMKSMANHLNNVVDCGSVHFKESQKTSVIPS